jgi:hypothetical protein
MPRVDRLLVATVGLQWLVTAGIALAASRTGSVYGDPATAGAAVDAASSVANGALPPTAGPLYPLLLAPLAGLTTRVEMVSSVVTTLNLVVLAPLASYCILEIGRRVAGQIYAAAAAAAWLLGPVLAVPYFNVKYRDTYVDDVLPALYGLTVHPAYIAMVLSLAAAALGLRAAAGAPRTAFVAGLIAATAIAFLPTAAGVAAGVILALVVARQWRGMAEALAGLAAAIAPTLIWRHRALGDTTITLGHPSWLGFQASMANVREFFWSNRLLQWLPVAGAVGLVRLARPAAAMLVGWMALATVIGVATSPAFDGGRIFIELIPAWPAYALLVAAIPALVPTLLRRLGSRTTGDARVMAISRAAASVAFVLAVLMPTALVILVGR